MGVFEQFPYTNFHDLNLDWILKVVKADEAGVAALNSWKLTHEAEYNQLKDIVEGLQNHLVDPIVPWDPSREYLIYSIVEYLGSNYIAIQNVPVGTNITDTNYWVAANTVLAQINAIGNTVTEVSERYPRRTYYRPEDYGAVVDDVNVDNAPFIQQAILDAIANKGIVLLSEGTYYTQTGILIDQRCMNVQILGTGLSSDGTYGTTINYSGSGIALHFSDGMWGCILENFDIICTGANSTALRMSKDDDPLNQHLVVRCIFENIHIKFRYHGIEMTSAAYVWFYNLSVMADADYTDVNRIGILLENDANTPTDNNIEYLHFENSRVVCRLVSDALNPYNSKGIVINNGTHIGCLDLDITDCDYGIYFTTQDTLDNGFHNFISLDLARIHEGIRIDLNAQPLQNTIFNQLSFTPPNTASNTDRVINLKRISGGLAYNARIKAYDITVRRDTGVLDYFVQAETTCLADGSCEFTFNGSAAPKIDNGSRRGINPYFCTYANIGNQTADLNDYKYSGLMPTPFAAASTNGPGFDCLILNFTCPAYTTQFAIPLASSKTLAFRIYNNSNQTWGAWQNFAKA